MISEEKVMKERLHRLFIAKVGKEILIDMGAHMSMVSAGDGPRVDDG